MLTAPRSIDKSLIRKVQEKIHLLYDKYAFGYVDYHTDLNGDGKGRGGGEKERKQKGRAGQVR